MTRTGDAGAILRELVRTLRIFRLAEQRRGQRSVWGTASGVLQCLELHDARPSELAREVSASVSVTSRAVDALEADGYVERRTDRNDGRACVISITDRGREHLRERHHEIADGFADVLQDWPDEDIQQALDVLQRLNIRLEDLTVLLRDTDRKGPSV